MKKRYAEPALAPLQSHDSEDNRTAIFAKRRRVG
jgi:hypothetical protein